MRKPHNACARVSFVSQRCKGTFKDKAISGTYYCSGMGLAKNKKKATAIHCAVIEAHVALTLLQATTDPDAFTKVVGSRPAVLDPAAEIQNLHAALKGLDAKRDRIALNYEDGLIDKAQRKDRLDGVATEQQRIHERLDDLEADYDPVAVAANVAELLDAELIDLDKAPNRRALYDLATAVDAALDVKESSLAALIAANCRAFQKGLADDLHQTTVTWLHRACARLDVRVELTDSMEPSAARILVGEGNRPAARSVMNEY